MQTPADTIGEAADIYIPKTAYTEWDDGKAHTDMDILNLWFVIGTLFVLFVKFVFKLKTRIRL